MQHGWHVGWGITCYDSDLLSDSGSAARWGGVQMIVTGQCSPFSIIFDETEA